MHFNKFNSENDKESIAMTLTENAEVTNIKESIKMDVKTSFAFKEALQKAAKEDRVTVGAYKCAKHMQGYPDRALYCVFPQNETNDDMMKIERILLEAYCREHRIQIVKVDSSQSLRKILLKHDKRKFEDNTDFNCALVQVAKSGLGKEEKEFLDTHWKALKEDHWHVVEIPS